VKAVIVVGVGALGSHVVQLLRNERATLRVIDFDKVEQKNVASQFHGKPGVGKPKVLALKQAMQFLFARDLETIPHRLAADNAKELLGAGDLVIDCLDNGASRRILQDFVRTAGIACVHGALAADGGFGRVVWDEAFAIDDEQAGGAATCDDGAHLPFVAIASAYLARAAQEFLATGRKIGFEINPGGAIRA
jgi:molybdopterin/thiamine biosynthesis adenylyltransferase